MSRTTVITRIPVVSLPSDASDREPIEDLEVSVSYSKGGEGWRPQPRGFSLHVQPCSYTRPEPGVTIKRYTPVDGIRTFLLEVGRYSAKSQREAVDLVDQWLPQLIERLLQTQKRWTLAPEVASEHNINLEARRG